MQPLQSENSYSFEILLFFVLNALVTVSLSLFLVYGAHYIIALSGGMYISEEQVKELEIFAKIVVLLSTLGIVDAIIWYRRKRYAGLPMLIYSGLHIAFIIYLWRGAQDPLFCALGFLPPLLADGVIGWYVGRNIFRPSKLNNN